MKRGPPVPAVPGIGAVVRQRADEEFLCLVDHEPAAASAQLGAWKGSTALLGPSPADGRLELGPFGAAVLRRPRG